MLGGFKNVILKKRVEDLERLIEGLRAKKRRKVEPEDPNKRFVTKHDVVMTKDSMEAEERIKKYMKKEPTRKSARKRVVSRRVLENGDSSE